MHVNYHFGKRVVFQVFRSCKSWRIHIETHAKMKYRTGFYRENRLINVWWKHFGVKWESTYEDWVWCIILFTQIDKVFTSKIASLKIFKKNWEIKLKKFKNKLKKLYFFELFSKNRSLKKNVFFKFIWRKYLLFKFFEQKKHFLSFFWRKNVIF